MAAGDPKGVTTVSWRVLVVDGDPKSGEAVCASLRQRGMIARAVTDPDAALDVLAAEPIDVVLTETCLPKRSGLCLLAEVRRRWGRRIAVILHTAWFPDHEQLEAYRSADAVMIKPAASADALAACIAGVLLRARDGDRDGQPTGAAPMPRDAVAPEVRE